MVDPDPAAEYALEASRELRGERYLGNEHQYLAPLAKHIVDQMDVYLGFAGRCDPVEQCHVFFKHRAMYLTQGLLLGIRESREGKGIQACAAFGSGKTRDFPAVDSGEAFFLKRLHIGPCDVGRCVEQFVARYGLDLLCCYVEPRESYEIEQGRLLSFATAYGGKCFVESAPVAAGQRYLDHFHFYAAVAVDKFLMYGDYAPVDKPGHMLFDVGNACPFRKVADRQFRYLPELPDNVELRARKGRKQIGVEIVGKFDYCLAFDFKAAGHRGFHHIARGTHIVIGYPMP